MNKMLRFFLLFFIISALPAFGLPLQSLLLPANGASPTVIVPAGKVLTIVSFTAFGVITNGGTPAIASVSMPASTGANPRTTVYVAQSYDPANINDTPHTVVIAGQGTTAKPAEEVQVTFLGASNVTTFVTYTISTN